MWLHTLCKLLNKGREQHPKWRKCVSSSDTLMRLVKQIPMDTTWSPMESACAIKPEENMTLKHDLDDDFRSSCRNVGQCHQQQSFSGLLSPGRSNHTNDRDSWVKTIYRFTMTLMMTSAQVVKMSVNVTNNSPSRDYSHPDDQTTQRTETPGLKPFTPKPEEQLIPLSHRKSSHTMKLEL